jgi:hypothetical protein
VQRALRALSRGIAIVGSTERSRSAEINALLEAEIDRGEVVSAAAPGERAPR